MSLLKKFYSLSLIKKIWYRLCMITIPNIPKIPKSTTKIRKINWGSKKTEEKNIIYPRIIWSYWNGSESPCAEACQKSWLEYKEDFQINIINSKNLKDFIPDFPELQKNLPVEKISNLVRLMLIERFGGRWMDYSTIISEPLTWIIKELESSEAEALLFYNDFPDEYKSDISRPIIENGFIAGKPNSKFIKQWRINYQKCIQSDDYTTFFQNNPDYKNLTSNFLNKDPSYLSYFVCYIAAQQTMLNPEEYNLLLLNAQDEYYKVYYQTNPPRNKRKFSEELLLKNYKINSPSRILKITGGHRHRIDEYIKHNCYKNFSLLGKYVAKDNWQIPVKKS